MADKMSEYDMSAIVPLLSFEELKERKLEIIERLGELDIKEPKLPPKRKVNKKSSKDGIPKDLVPFEPKTDTQWDFVMKEMMWLAADFQAERKRQVSLGKKVASGVKQYHKTIETRRVRQLAEAELKRRRLGAKIGRELKGWWTKIERVVAYKQKVDAEKERRSAMNQQLVSLVKQTERYGESLSHQLDLDSDDDVDEKPRKRKRKKRRMTIEEALAAEDSKLRRRKRTADYARINREETEDEFYGESTTSDSGSDGSFVVDSDSDDDETTMREAEAEELRELRQRRQAQDDDDDDDDSFRGDPEELRKLQEESAMDIRKVLERLRQETEDNSDQTDAEVDEDPPAKRKRVTFAQEVRSPSNQNRPKRSERRRCPKIDTGSDADDDGDASDVEDFEDPGNTSDGSEEFKADPTEHDDETTIAAEERLGREMSAEDEINMLEREGEMSIEELKKLYSIKEHGAPSDTEESGDDHDVSDGSEEFKADPMDEHDDETTIAAEERLGREMSVEDEISLLQREGEMSIEELRKLYSVDNNADSGDTEGSDHPTVVAAAADSVVAASGRVSRRWSRRGLRPPEDRVNGTSSVFEADDGAAEDEFQPTHEVDDETTIEAEERMGREMSPEEELRLLQQENEIPVGRLRAMYAAMNGDAMDAEDDSIVSSNTETLQHQNQTSAKSLDTIISDAVNDDGDTEEYSPDFEHMVDDETTIAAEEKLGRDMSYEDELALLKRESEMSVEELRNLYCEVESEQEEEEEDDRKMPAKKLEAPKEATNGRTKGPRMEQKSDGEDEGLAALKSLQESEERARATTASRPFLLTPWVKLRAYQQVGLNWLVSIQTRRLNGILADEMGLGKTLQTISLLGYLAAYKGIWGPHLVIVPTSCIVNWETEIKRFCPAMKVLCYYGSAKRRKELRIGWTKANCNHVVVTSYQLAVQDSFAFKRKKVVLSHPG